VKQIKYICNLCRGQADEGQMIGIHWTVSGPGGNSFEPKHPQETETHLCRFCVSAINAQMSILIGYGK
jgi:hypothetical protein